jgi:hypothetical protein
MMGQLLQWAALLVMMRNAWCEYEVAMLVAKLGTLLRRWITRTASATQRAGAHWAACQRTKRRRVRVTISPYGAKVLSGRKSDSDGTNSCC